MFENGIVHTIDNELKEKEKYEMLMLPQTALTESKEVSADTEISS